MRLLIQANRIRECVLAGHELTIEEVARQEEVGASYAARLIRLAFLATDIVSAMLFGRQPVALTARSLMSDTRLPLGWPSSDLRSASLQLSRAKPCGAGTASIPETPVPTRETSRPCEPNACRYRLR